MRSSTDSLSVRCERKATAPASLQGWLLTGLLLVLVCTGVSACGVVDDNEADRETEEEVEEGVPRPPGRP